MKYGSLSLGQIEAIINKLGGLEGAMDLLRDELVLVKSPIKWEEDDQGIIRFSVTSDGTSGKEWIERLENKGFVICEVVKNFLLSENFQPTDGITTKVAVIRGARWSERDRCPSTILDFANKTNEFSKVNFEVACLIRDMFSNERLLKALRLGFIRVIHEPIKSGDSDKSFFICIDSNSVRGYDLKKEDFGSRTWYGAGSFAFASI